jgi:hypothetical protein
MSENISSNVLFHFTRSLDTIIDILKSGFHPHYCPEYSVGPLHAKAASDGCAPLHAAPMICFCDIPLSLIRKHLKEYGKFGIGLIKSWGIKHGITPVFYMHEQSQMFKPLSDRVWTAKNQNDSNATHDLTMLLAYAKPFRGNAWRRGEIKRGVHFYDEREWRYVPQLTNGEKLFIERAEYSDKAKVKRLHNSFRKRFSLCVEPDDIMYLIVPDDGYILQLVRRLHKLYGHNDATIVTTAIMTIDCIEDDV